MSMQEIVSPNPAVSPTLIATVSPYHAVKSKTLTKALVPVKQNESQKVSSRE